MRPFSKPVIMIWRNIQVWRAQRATLVPFEEIYPLFTIRGQVDRGCRAVPIAQIVGSLSRHAEYDRRWRPTSDRTLFRRLCIMDAYRRGVALPPVELYKLGGSYFVCDGHHRIAVARQRGQLDVDAHVVEIIADGMLASKREIAHRAPKHSSTAAAYAQRMFSEHGRTTSMRRLCHLVHYVRSAAR